MSYEYDPVLSQLPKTTEFYVGFGLPQMPVPVLQNTELTNEWQVLDYSNATPITDISRLLPVIDEAIEPIPVVETEIIEEQPTLVQGTLFNVNEYDIDHTEAQIDNEWRVFEHSEEVNQAFTSVEQTMQELLGKDHGNYLQEINKLLYSKSKTKLINSFVKAQGFDSNDPYFKQRVADTRRAASMQIAIDLFGDIYPDFELPHVTGSMRDLRDIVHVDGLRNRFANKINRLPSGTRLESSVAGLITSVLSFSSEKALLDATTSSETINEGRSKYPSKDYMDYNGEIRQQMIESMLKIVDYDLDAANVLLSKIFSSDSNITNFIERSDILPYSKTLHHRGLPAEMRSAIYLKNIFQNSEVPDLQEIEKLLNGPLVDYAGNIITQITPEVLDGKGAVDHIYVDRDTETGDITRIRLVQTKSSIHADQEAFVLVDAETFLNYPEYYAGEMKTLNSALKLSEFAYSLRQSTGIEVEATIAQVSNIV